VEYVREEAIVATELLAHALEEQAQSWQLSHKRRLAAVAELSPLVKLLAELRVNVAHQERRKGLDATPREPPPGVENGPWAATALEARQILAARAQR
jgi:hypothetical protein